VKLHLSLATRNLKKSVAFYATLLGAAPAKQLRDYALFITADPGLELALDLDKKAKAPRRQHFGLAVDSVAAVDAQIERLQSAGYDVAVERAETCCYANQTKVWARDPDGRRWETYFVHAEVDA
jgi:catechol 2,3-dioxygenase-like lactoylglutathione lyase family enzyme